MEQGGESAVTSDAYSRVVAYGLFGTFVAAEGERDELVRHLLHAAALLADDPGCRQYVVGATGDHDVAVFEVWDDKSAHDSSLRREDIRALIEVVRPLIVGVGSQTVVDVRGGKGV